MKCTTMRRSKLRYFEQLEKRCLLAGGLIPLDLSIPLMTNEADGDLFVDGSAVIKLSSMVLDPRADDVSDVSLTGYEFSGAGTFSGPVDGVVLSGSFITNPIESPNHPDIPIQVNPLAQTIDFVLTQFGTFDASSEFGPVSGTFTIVAELTVVFDTREVIGQSTTTFTAAGRVETTVSPVQVTGAIPVSVEFPDASKPFVSGRIFHDVNDNGTRQPSEVGVAGIRVTQMDGATELASVASDANGFYSFYNLGEDLTSIQFRDLPRELDFGKMNAGESELVDSNIDSRTGMTPSLHLDTQPVHLNVDAALRSTPFEWQNPNVTTDVNGDGQTTALDALAIINLLSQTAAGSNRVDLVINREPGEAFYDVDGNGFANASDALAVIFGLYADLLASEGEQESMFAIENIARDRIHVDLHRQFDMNSVPRLF